MRATATLLKPGGGGYGKVKLVEIEYQTTRKTKKQQIRGRIETHRQERKGEKKEERY